MNRLALACALGVLCAFSAFAVPTFTPAVDGVKDAGWGAVPDHSSTTQALPLEFNLDGGMYVTDDNQNIYIGYDADNDPFVDGMNPHIHILMDVNNTAAGGGIGCWGATATHYAMTYLPEYDIVMQWNTENESALAGFTGLNRWDGYWNQLTELTNDAGGGNSWTELAIPKALIGILDAGVPLNFSMWLRPSWSGGAQGAVACLPADADFPSNGGAVPGTFNSQWAYTTQIAFGESDPPAILSWHQIDRDELEIVFDEPMNTTTLANLANYTPNGWSINTTSYTTATTVGLRSNFNFVETNPYSVILEPGITDVAGNAIDPAADSAGWTAVDYADLVVVVAAPAAYTCIRFKGSFNFYHEYDPTWQGGSHGMFDNGTNGDSVAGDGRWTIVWPLVPSASIYEWGAETCSGQWLIQGPNQQVTIADGGQYYAFYEVPDPTTAPCDVTFRLDKQFETWNYQSVHVSGSAFGWAYPGQVMTDADLDSQFVVTYTIPAGSARHVEFKFQYADSLTPGDEWEWIGNRSFDIVGEPATIDLGNMFWNDWIAPPANVTAIKTGADVRVRWNPAMRVNFQVFSHTVPDSVMENGSMIGTTGNSFFDTPPTTVKSFYQVRTVYP